MFSKITKVAQEIEQTLTESLPGPASSKNEVFVNSLEELNQIAQDFENNGFKLAAESVTNLIEKFASPINDEKIVVLTDAIEKIKLVYDNLALAVDEIAETAKEQQIFRSEVLHGLRLAAVGLIKLRNEREFSENQELYESEYGPPTERGSGVYEAQESPATVRSASQEWIDELNKVGANKKKNKSKSKTKKSTKSKSLSSAQQVKNLKEVGWVFPAPRDCEICKKYQEHAMMAHDQSCTSCEHLMADDLRERGGVLIPLMDEGEVAPLDSMFGDDYDWLEEKSVDNPFEDELIGDYEECGECGFDHAYEPQESENAHQKLELDQYNWLNS